MKAIQSHSVTYQIELEQTVEALRKGHVILYPTDTLWGLGCDIHNSAAFDRIAQIKKSALDEKYVILVDSIERLKLFAPMLHPRVETLLLYYHRPLTIIYDDVQNLPAHLVSPDGSAAIRVVNDHFCGDIISILDRPIIGTMAAYEGAPYPNELSKVSETIKQQADYIVHLDVENQSEGLPSILARYNEKGELEFIRE
jgi:L-threonylcarbamoyladenylate synthase